MDTHACYRKCQEYIPQVSADAIISMQEYSRTERVITAHQAFEVTRTLHNVQEDITHYSTEISRLETQLLALNINRNFLEHYVQTLGRSILAPVRTLPSEVIHEILVHCGSWGNTISQKQSFDMSRQPAWAVSNTCIRWRKIALSCKPLWSTIFLDLSGNPSAKTQLAVLAMNRCLRQSHHYPLTLTTKDLQSDAHGPGAAMKSLISEAHRWRNLTIINGISGTILPSVIWTSICLPTLQTLNITITDEDPILGLQAFQRSPQLCDVNLHGSLKGPVLPVSFPWSQLTKIGLSHFNGPIIQMLSACPNLESLSLGTAKQEGGPTGLRNSDPVSLTKLRVLRLDIDLGSDHDDSLSLVFSCLTLASLTELIILSHKKGYGVFEWSQPNIETFVRRSQCQITSLTLEVPLSDTQALRLFETLPTIRKLTLEDSQSKLREETELTITTALVIGLGVFIGNQCPRGVGVLLPNLEHLILRSLSRAPSRSKAHTDLLDDKAFADMIKSRLVPSTRFASVYNVRHLQSLSVVYFSPGRKMDMSVEQTLESLKDDDGFKFSWCRVDES